MDIREFFEQQFIFNDWANWRLISFLSEQKSEKSQRILAHILITEKEYFERFYGKDSTGFNFWQSLSIEECGRLAQENFENYRNLLRNFDNEGLEHSVEYKTSEGIACQSKFRELLTQVLFHSAHHRGNIMLKIREEGFQPPAIDYIIYLREK